MAYLTNFRNKTPATGFSTRHKQVKGINIHINIYLVVVTPYFLKNPTLWVSHLMSKLIVTDWLCGWLVYTPNFQKHPNFKNTPNFHNLNTPPLINFYSTNSLLLLDNYTRFDLFFSPWFIHFVSLKLLPSVMLNNPTFMNHPGHFLHPIIPKSTTLRLFFFLLFFPTIPILKNHDYLKNQLEKKKKKHNHFGRLESPHFKTRKTCDSKTWFDKHR